MFITKKKIETLKVCNIFTVMDFVDTQCKVGFYAKRLPEICAKYSSSRAHTPVIDYLVVALQLLTEENLRKVYDDCRIKECMCDGWESFQRVVSHGEGYIRIDYRHFAFNTTLIQELLEAQK